MQIPEGRPWTPWRHVTHSRFHGLSRLVYFWAPGSAAPKALVARWPVFVKYCPGWGEVQQNVTYEIGGTGLQSCCQPETCFASLFAGPSGFHGVARNSSEPAVRCRGLASRGLLVLGSLLRAGYDVFSGKPTPRKAAQRVKNQVVSHFCSVWLLFSFFGVRSLLSVCFRRLDQKHDSGQARLESLQGAPPEAIRGLECGDGRPTNTAIYGFPSSGVHCELRIWDFGIRNQFILFNDPDEYGSCPSQS